MGAQHLSWMKLARGKSSKRIAVWHWRRAHTGFCSDVISKELCLGVEREGGRSTTPPQPHTYTHSRGVHTHMLTHLKHPMSHCWRSRCGGLLAWASWEGDVGRMALGEAISKETFEAGNNVSFGECRYDLKEEKTTLWDSKGNQVDSVSRLDC